MDLSRTVEVQMNLGTLSTLIAGLYVSYSAINIEAVPSSLFIEIAERLAEYLPNWHYDEISFEDWIKYELIIMPKEFFSEVEVNQMKKSKIYIERRLGNVTLIASANISWE